MRASSVHAHRVESLLDELEAMHRKIADRAFEIFRNGGARLGHALDDWLAAERQTLWKPAIEISQRDEQLLIEVAAAGVEPRQLDIQATPDTILIKADVDHTHPAEKGTMHVCEFEAGRLFRLIQLPVRIDPDSVKAGCQNGLIRLSAAVAEAARPRTVKIQAA